MSNIRRDINNTRWKRHGHWPVMKFKRVSTFKPSSCSTVGMLACFWRHQFNRVILMIRTSWRGKRLWNLSIVRIRDYPPAYWFFAWTHIFFPRDLLVQVRKNIYVAKEKKKEKKKGTIFPTRFARRNEVILKFNIYSLLFLIVTIYL